MELKQDYTMCDLVKSTNKGIDLMVICEIPKEKRRMFGVPEDRRAYICSKRGTNEWSAELAENLEPISKIRLFLEKINPFKNFKLKLPTININISTRMFK